MHFDFEGEDTFKKGMVKIMQDIKRNGKENIYTSTIINYVVLYW